MYNMNIYANKSYFHTPDFLVQLRKILSEEDKSIMEWSGGMIYIHKPKKLADEILPKYFRHSKFASFQRQLNYFGFRKASGKGKMTPCTYHNQSTTADVNSLLQVKKKLKVTPIKSATENKLLKHNSPFQFDAMYLEQNQTFQTSSFLPSQTAANTMLPTSITSMVPEIHQFYLKPTFYTPIQVANNRSIENLPNVTVQQSQPILHDVPLSGIFDPSMSTNYSMKDMNQFEEENVKWTNYDNENEFSLSRISSLTDLAAIPSSCQEFIDVPYIEPLTTENLYAMA